MTNGWIKIHRQMLDKGWFKKPNAVHLWIYLLTKASFADNEKMWNGESVILKPGQFITGRKEISKETGIHESTVERLLIFFETKERQIEQQKTNTSRLISIVNYSKYNDTEQRLNNKRTTAEQRANTIEEGKEGKEGKEISYAFESENFKDKYGEWIVAKKESKKTLTPLTITKQMKFLSKFSEHVAIKILEKSIMNGWQGLFEPSVKENVGGVKPVIDLTDMKALTQNIQMVM